MLDEQYFLSFLIRMNNLYLYFCVISSIGISCCYLQSVVLVAFCWIGDHCGTQEVSITPDDILTCEVCFSNIAVLFLLLNNVGADKIRKKMKLHVNTDPAFDPAGPGKVYYKNDYYKLSLIYPVST